MNQNCVKSLSPLLNHVSQLTLSSNSLVTAVQIIKRPVTLTSNNTNINKNSKSKGKSTIPTSIKSTSNLSQYSLLSNTKSESVNEMEWNRLIKLKALIAAGIIGCGSYLLGSNNDVENQSTSIAPKQEKDRILIASPPPKSSSFSTRSDVTSNVSGYHYNWQATLRSYRESISEKRNSIASYAMSSMSHWSKIVEESLVSLSDSYSSPSSSSVSQKQLVTTKTSPPSSSIPPSSFSFIIHFPQLLSSNPMIDSNIMSTLFTWMSVEADHDSPFPYLFNPIIYKKLVDENVINYDGDYTSPKINFSEMNTENVKAFVNYYSALFFDIRNNEKSQFIVDSLLDGVNEKIFMEWKKVKLETKKDTERHYESLSRILSEFVHTSDTRIKRVLQNALADLNHFITSPKQNMAEPKSIILDGLAVSMTESLKEHDFNASLSAIKALATLSEFKEYASEIINKGGVGTILNTLNENIHVAPLNYRLKMYSEVARLLANMSFLEESFFLVTRSVMDLLIFWSKSNHNQLSFQANRALANIYSAHTDLPRYADGVHLITPHSQLMNHNEKTADVVFVHGLLGNPFITWRQEGEEEEDIKIDKKQPTTPYKTSEANEKTSCWPRDWIGQDLPNVRLLGIEYETALSEWTSSPQRTAQTLRERALEFLEKLNQAQLGKKPIVFVTHSMGGLLVKQMMLVADEEPQYKHIADQLKGIVFMSTPHAGSPLATHSEKLKYLLLPSVEVEELSENSKQLQELNEQFRRKFAHRVEVVSFGETKETLIVNNKISATVVSLESSNPGFGSFVKIDKDHINICKPASKEDPIYSQTLLLITKSLQS